MTRATATNGSDVLLDVRGVTAGFGTNTVLHGVDLQVREGEIAGVFGLNGAGKSVTMKVLAGVVPAWSGTITFGGRDLGRVTAEGRVALGIGHVPQGRQVFAGLTVEENLRLGAYTSRRKDKRDYPARLATVFDEFPRLGERRTQRAGTLSGGEQAALAVGRALINRPRLVLVDEPSAGLAPIVTAQLFEILQQVAASGVTMVVVEQNVAFGLRLVTRANIMQTGRVVHSCPVDALDGDTLARHLGIGPMLAAGTSGALRSRRRPPKPAAKKKAPAAKKALAKTRASVKKKAPTKKGVAKKKEAR
jgi:branched-chain amino acid transport system ATP-binding protein